MRKASRLFEIIQILRRSRTAVTAERMAGELEVSPRSVYRDIAALQAMRVPIEGERGLGYILRPGFDLPPLMFSVAESEAILLGLALLARTADRELIQAAASVNRKIAAVVPEPLRRGFDTSRLYAWGSVAAMPAGIDLAMVRTAIRDERKLDIGYRDEQGRESRRTIRPLAMIYYSESNTIVGWCEMRQAIRNFRADRVSDCSALAEGFKGQGDELRRQWVSGWATGNAGG